MTKQDFKREAGGIILFFLSALIWFGFTIKGSVGPFGEGTRVLLTGLLGFSAYFISYLFGIVSIWMIMGKEKTFLVSKIWSALALLVIISAIRHAGSEEILDSGSVFYKLKNLFQAGVRLEGGGLLGGLIAIPFLRIFQTIGTIVILIAIAMVDIMILTDISVESGYKRTKAMIQKIVLVSKKTAQSIFLFIAWSFGWLFSLKKGISNLTRRILYKTPSSEIEQSEGELDEEDRESKNTDMQIENSNALMHEVTIQNSQVAQETAPYEALMIEEDVQALDANAQRTDEEKQRDTQLKEQEWLMDSEQKRNPLEAVRTNEQEKDEEPEQQGDDTKNVQTKTERVITKPYRLPSLMLLDKKNGRNSPHSYSEEATLERKRKLEATLKSFGVEAKVTHITIGPAVTRFELTPALGVKVSKIVSLSDDIALSFATSGIRIEAPIPGKSAIGIEVPNKDVTPVLLSEVLSSVAFRGASSKLSIALGVDITGERVVADIAKMPHLLVAGATGAGKSVCMNSLIVSLIYKASPDEVKLLMIDPKVVELGIYNGIPHLLIPVVTDPKKAAGALNWAVVEMTSRYRAFAEKGVRDIFGYNDLMREAKETVLPQIVILIDELADLMMVAPNDVEDAICRLAQMARAAGMHLIIATQRPSVDVITGIIKANIPSRIAFAVTSQVDSRTILDMAGAEKLLGKGDMLFYPVGEAKPRRVKGSFVTEKEIERVVQFVKEQNNTTYDEVIVEKIQSTPVGKGKVKLQTEDDYDPLLEQVMEMIVDIGQASASLIQRKFKVGYARAARIMDQLEDKKVIGGFEGGKPRNVLMSKQDLMEHQMKKEPS